MTLEIKKTVKKVSVGTHLAMPVQIIDLGQQYQTDWKTGEIKQYEDSGEDIIKHMVYITFEFPFETDQFDGVDKPLWLGKKYTVSTHELAALTGLLKAIKPGVTDLRDIVGLPTMLEVGETSGGNPKIVSATSAPNKYVVDNPASPLDGEVVDTTSLELFNEPRVYSIEDGKNEVFEQLPKWLQEQINEQAGQLKPQF